MGDQQNERGESEIFEIGKFAERRNFRFLFLGPLEELDRGEEIFFAPLWLQSYTWVQGL
jgi:hypothetical protein